MESKEYDGDQDYLQVKYQTKPFDIQIIIFTVVGTILTPNIIYIYIYIYTHTH